MKKILLVTHQFPLLPYCGTSRREHELVKELAKDFIVYICCISRNYEEDVAFSKKFSSKNIHATLFRANPTLKDVSFYNEKNTSVQRHRDYSLEAKSFVQALILQEEINLIQISGFWMLNILPKYRRIPLVLETQNIEYSIWVQLAELYTFNHEVFQKQALLTKKEELRAWKQVDAIVSITNEDTEVIHSYFPKKKIALVTSAMDHTPDVLENVESDPKMSSETFNLLYVGNFDYAPNEDAARYFCEKILPKVIEKVKNFNVYFVGNIGESSISEIEKIHPCIKVIGRVSSISSYVKDCKVFICPLRYGGGIKTKLLEAIFMNKAIITTTIGAQGMGSIEEVPFIIADSEDSFAEETIRICLDESYRLKKELDCEAFKKKWPTWSEVGLTLREFYTELISEPSKIKQPQAYE